MAGRHMHLLMALCLTTLIISEGVNAAPPPSEIEPAKDINNNNESLSGVHGQLTEDDNQKKGSVEKHRGHSAYKAEMKCLEGWNEWHGSCYFYDPSSKKNWHDARMDCVRKSQGRGDLVSIHSADENGLVNLISDGASCWIGFYVDPEIHKEENFRWSDKTQRGYTNWNKGTNEPNDKEGEEDCVQLKEPGLVNGGWNDDNCAKVYTYVCKGPKVMMCSGMVV